MAIGSSMAAFFIAVQVQPSRFFGLVLLVMLAYKTVQAALGAIIKNKRLYKLLFTLCIILEIAGAITAGAVSSNAPEIWWQIFYSLALCVFYSMGQIYMRKPHKKEFWNKVMISYLMGFIYIFMLTIALILIILSQGEGADGIGEALANGIAGGIDTGGGKKSKKGKAIKK